jgi:hypothetical protein
MPPANTKGFPADNQQCLSVPSVEELPLSDGNEEPEDIDMNLVTSKLRYHSNESIYDDVKKSDEHHDQEEIVGAISVAVTTNQRKTFQKRRVAKVKSTPAFLNQISEERESDLDDSPRASPRVRRSSRRPLNVIQKTRHPSQTSSSGGRRSSSHSSSSEDDGDLDKKMRRLSTERCRRSPKRRSDDEGDGDDGDGESKAPHGVARKKMMSEKQQNSGSNKDNSSAESGNSSNEQGKSAQLGLHSELHTDKLFNVYIKLDEDQSTNSADSTVNRPANYYKDLSNTEQPLACFENSTEKPRFIIGEQYVDKMDTNVEILANSENVIKSHQCSHSDTKSGEDNVKSENGLVDFKNFSMMSKGSMVNSEHETNNLENVPKAHKEVKVSEDISNDESEMLDMTRNVGNDQCIDGDLSKKKENVDMNCEESEINCENPDEIKKDEVVVDGILEIFKERSLTNETLGNISDKENVDVTTKDYYANDDTARMRGSDIDEIEMYMKSKELESVTVRTIFNNPKVSRVTSNCCKIV